MNLLKLLNVIAEVILRALRLKRVNELKQAKEEALNEGDQRKLEEALGGSSGAVPDGKFHGMYTRDVKTDPKKTEK